MTGFLGFGRRVAQTELETLLETVLDRKLAPIHNQLNQLEIRIGRLEDNAQKTSEAISYLRAKIEGLEVRMDSFDFALKENRDALEASIKENRDALEDSTKELRKDIHNNAKGIEFLRGRVDVLIQLQSAPMTSGR